MNKPSLTRKARTHLIDHILGRKMEVAGAAAPASAECPIRYSSIPDAFTRFDRFPGYEKMLVPKAASERLGLANPFFRSHDGVAGATTLIGGREFINFSNYSYLGLAGHPAVSRAAKEAIDRYGTSASASRLVAGERPAQRKLEEALANLYEVDDCIVFVSGHATNVSTIGCLFGPKDLVIHDSLIHNSVLQGIQLSGAARRSFPHNDMAALEQILAEIRAQFERVLIVTEGLYSMDGDIPDLPALIRIKRRHVEHLKYAAPGFVYSVGMAPSLAAASLEALRIMQREPERVARLRERGQQFLELMQSLGVNTGLAQGYAVIPAIIGSSLKAARLSNQFFDAGINVQPIIHPAVEEKAARLRFFLSAMHTDQHVRYTCEVMKKLTGLH